MLQRYVDVTTGGCSGPSPVPGTTRKVKAYKQALIAGWHRGRRNVPRGSAWSHGRGRAGAARGEATAGGHPARGGTPGPTQPCPAAEGRSQLRGRGRGTALRPPRRRRLHPSLPPGAEHGGAMWRYVSGRQLDGFRRYKVTARPGGRAAPRPGWSGEWAGGSGPCCGWSSRLYASRLPFAPLCLRPRPAPPTLRLWRVRRDPGCAPAVGVHPQAGCPAPGRGLAPVRRV